jgi:hypothetical protein
MPLVPSFNVYDRIHTDIKSGLCLDVLKMEFIRDELKKGRCVCGCFILTIHWITLNFQYDNS